MNELGWNYLKGPQNPKCSEDPTLKTKLWTDMDAHDIIFRYSSAKGFDLYEATQIQDLYTFIKLKFKCIYGLYSFGQLKNWDFGESSFELEVLDQSEMLDFCCDICYQSRGFVLFHWNTSRYCKWREYCDINSDKKKLLSHADFQRRKCLFNISIS